MKFGLATPLHWEIRKLEEISLIVRGASPRPKGDPRYFGGKIPWITIRDINREKGKYLTQTVEGVTELGAERSRLLKHGTLILSNSGSVCIPKILKVEGCIHDGFLAFQWLCAGVEKSFLYHLFNHIREIVKNAFDQGITQVNLNTKTVKDFEIPIPPLNEQKRIVAKIEALQARTRKAREALAKVEPLLEQLKQAVLAAAFRGDLTAQWRSENPDVEPADQLLTRIRSARRKAWEEAELAKMTAKGKAPKNDKWKQRYKEPFSPKGHVNKKWGAWPRVDEVGDVTLGRQRAPRFHTGPNMIPYLRVANVFEDRIDISDVMEMHFSDKDFQRFSLKPGDILLNEGQSLELVGRPAKFNGEVSPCCFTNTLIRYRSSEEIDEDYAFLAFLWQMKTGQYIAIASRSVNIAHLGRERFAGLTFPLVQLKEQKVIVQKVRAVLDAHQLLIRHVKLLEEKLDQLDQAILEKAFRGELVPQDPDDEPASVLLDRIAAEKAAQAAVKPKRRRRVAAVT